MTNRGKTALTVAAIIVAGIALTLWLSSLREPPGRRERPDRPVRMSTVRVDGEEVRATLQMTGPLTALDRVEVYAEVSGILLETPTRFREGNRFRRGEPLIRIDDSVYRNNVLAQKSSLLNQLTLLLPDLSLDFPGSAPRWNDYLEDFDLERPLPPLPEAGSEKERYYIASRNIYNLYYTIKGMEATLEKYAIRAPYNGVVTESRINPGTLVRQGQMLGEFMSTDTYEMEAFADLEEVRLISVGMPAVMTSTDMPGTFEGTITRINETIDRSSQLVGVYITTDDDRLRDGMYMTATIESEPIPGAARIPRTALTGNGTVWVARDSVLTAEPVKIDAVEEKHVIVRGLSAGDIVVDRPSDEIREGMRLSAPRGGEGPAGKAAGQAGGEAAAAESGSGDLSRERERQ